MSNKTNCTSYLGSIGWKEESLIIRVDDMKKSTNCLVFGIEEKLKAQTGDASNKDV